MNVLPNEQEFNTETRDLVHKERWPRKNSETVRKFELRYSNVRL
jgi:hypothetical protein